MVDVEQPNSPSGQIPRSAKSLSRWIRQLLNLPQLQVKSRSRGNHLHILLESQPGPAASVMPTLIRAIKTTEIEHLLPPETPQIYRVSVYGRTRGQTQPDWTKLFYLNPPESNRPQLEETPLVGKSSGEPSHPPSSGLGSQANPDAIARYLSQRFNDLGVSVRAKVEALPESSLRRLLVRCEAGYSPDPSLLADPIAQQLRELKLVGFQDAVVFGQVSGEPKPDWILRVDLTPPDQILRDWAHWGDIQAISRLLNEQLLPQQIEVTALLKEVILHLTCRSTVVLNQAESEPGVPDKQRAIATISSLLNAIGPQGIQAATVYGVEASPSEPLWVDWIDLSPARHQTALELAQQGDLDAIAFLLSRVLNPDLTTKLATGGVRVQIRRKDDLLHIMTDAPTCPAQQTVGTAVVKCLQPLQIPAVTGVRVYGRRAGQKQPLWSYGFDFAARSRLVPEVTPEFAASDAYVGDLLEPPGALVLRSDIPLADARSQITQWLERGIAVVQRSLIRSQLFTRLESSLGKAGTVAESRTAQADSHHTPVSNEADSLGVALVWSLVGILLVVQSDWLIGRWLQPTLHTPPAAPAAPVVSKSPTAPPQLPQLSLQKSPTASGAFNASGFTEASKVTLDESAPFPASPLQPKANFADRADAYPTFNSHQLDEKLVLYRHFLTEHGRPDVLIIGSSRALRGVDPIALKQQLSEQGYPNVTVFNFGINGATAQVVDLIIRQLLPKEALPRVILWADGARAFNSGRVDITFNGIVASPGYHTFIAGRPPLAGTLTAQATPMVQPAETGTTAAGNQDQANQYQANQYPANQYQSVNRELDTILGALSVARSHRDQFRTQVRDQVAKWLPIGKSVLADNSATALKEFSDATSPAASAANSPSAMATDGRGMIDVDGFLPLPNRFNPATYYQKYSRVLGDYDSDYDSFALVGSQTEALANLTQFTKAEQIPLVFVNLPLTSDYLDSTRKQYEEQFQQHMLQQSAQLGFIYRDLSQALLGQFDYFSDPSHLNRYGGYEVSRRLAQDVMVPWNRVKP